MKNIKEKVLKEVDEKSFLTSYNDIMEEAIDLTLAERNKEVSKVIDKRLNILNKSLEEETAKAPKHSSRRLSILYSAIDELNLIEQKLGIK